MNKRKRIYLILTICWMVLIFSFSARNADISEKDSGRVGRLVGEWFVPGFKEWNSSRQEQFVEAVDFPVRKTAHATEYAILGMLVFGTVYDEKKDRKHNFLFPWILGTSYAATDEFHQLFVPGRSGQIRDVLIDSSGVLAGLLVIYFVMWIRKCKIHKNVEKNKMCENNI